jgi:hypothetical protein
MLVLNLAKAAIECVPLFFLIHCRGKTDKIFLMEFADLSDVLFNYFDRNKEKKEIQINNSRERDFFYFCQ